MGKHDWTFKDRIRKRWRAWLRAVHRDVGYLVVGLTFIYALSGLAINHFGEWDPNFKSVVDSYSLDGPYPEDEEKLVQVVLDELQLPADELTAGYYIEDTQFELALASGTAVLDTQRGVIKRSYKEPRFFLRVANWLHYNRGKGAWTYIADGYAILLLYLATSGVFMLKGRKGFWGRGAILVVAGAAVPIAYVQLSGGP